ncbi:MAG: hypothetical protein M1825_000991 [Sarcosagium campestre]|nr:MAG: hypothetical protein M1825_000991 [Sarcosagium campestre]
MANSFWYEDKYRTHFFCIFCGGPFARVFRTESSKEKSRSSSKSQSRNLDVSAPGITTTAKNDRLSETDIINNAKRPYQLDHQINRRLNRDGRVPVRDDAGSTVRHAYDGDCIREKEMKWTHVLRALIHSDAQRQPYRATGPGNLPIVYLTGRGRVSEDASWAAAYPSIHDDLDESQGEDEDPNDRNIYDDQFGFHLYQEPSRTNRTFTISSLPFHEECWDIFIQALDACRKARDLPYSQLELILDLDLIWSYFCELIPTSVNGQISDLTIQALYSDTAGDTISHLSAGCMGGQGYREAQSCNDGKRWLHIEGLHSTGLSRNPFLEGSLPSNRTGWGSTACYAAQQTTDPFNRIPPEVLVEVAGYLSYSEWSRWRLASTSANFIPLPQRIYRRFVEEEVHFLPESKKQLEKAGTVQGHVKRDWHLVLEHITASWKSNSGLRNRRRIWRIVQPMADEIVERSKQNLIRISGVDEAVSEAFSVVRGNVGVTSGREGQRTTVMFIEAFPAVPLDQHNASESYLASQDNRPADAASIDIEILRPHAFCRALRTIHIWLHPAERYVCGLEFLFAQEGFPGHVPSTIRRFFGTRTVVRESFGVEAEALIFTGFALSWGEGCLRGIQFVFEDQRSSAREYRNNEFLSPRFGDWRFPQRRLVAPRRYRNLAGMTGFVASSGHIETFAIVEERMIPENDARGLVPPPSVPLSHQEASLWKVVPPNDVDLTERVGPALEDWRTRASECEVFAETAIHPLPGQLEEIVSYTCGDYLAGLRFQYRNEDGQSIHRDVGRCIGQSCVLVQLDADDDAICAAVVGHGGSGIHCLQLVTSFGVNGPPSGERYLGAQAIFAHDKIVPNGTDVGRLTHLPSPIIGFHCLYSAELSRFVQLGVVTRADTRISRPMTPDTCLPDASPLHTPTSSPVSIPFIVRDQHGSSWVDGPPPKWLARCRKNSDPIKALRQLPVATFSGWVSFRDAIACITIYGDMEGVKFSYAGEARSPTSFGNTRHSLQRRTYQFAEDERRITCITALSAPSSDRLPNIQFFSRSQTRPSEHIIEVESEFLAGIMFRFTAEGLVDWQPLFDWSRPPTNLDLGGMFRDHWKSPEVAQHFPSAKTDQDVLGKLLVLANFFDHPVDGKADGAKGYVCNNRFCGLLFRRSGLWDEEPLGLSSPYATDFLLKPGEEFVSMYASKTGHFGEGGALALCTNFGRTSPWFGSLFSGKPVLKTAPRGQRALGIYMAFSKPTECDNLGIIYNDGVGGDFETTLVEEPPIPAGEILQQDPDTCLYWATNKSSLPRNCTLTPVIGPESHLTPTPLRAFCLLAPHDLQRIDAYLHTVPGRFGLKALKIQGSRRMGTAILGDWQDKYAKPGTGQSMHIQGCEGERIVGLSVVFQNHSRGRRIVALNIKTNFGQEYDIVSWTKYTDEAPPEMDVQRKELLCPPREEIIGFHYILGLYVHEIGLVTRAKSTTSAVDSR